MGKVGSQFGPDVKKAFYEMADLILAIEFLRVTERLQSKNNLVKRGTVFNGIRELAGDLESIRKGFSRRILRICLPADSRIARRLLQVDEIFVTVKTAEAVRGILNQMLDRYAACTPLIDESESSPIVRVFRYATPYPASFDQEGFHLSFFEAAYAYASPINTGIRADLSWRDAEGEELRKSIGSMLSRLMLIAVREGMTEKATNRGFTELEKEYQRATTSSGLSLDEQSSSDLLGVTTRISPKTEQVIRLFKGNLTVDQVVERLGISASNARKIKSRYRHLIGDE